MEGQYQATAARFHPTLYYLPWGGLLSLLLRVLISPSRPERAETRSDPASIAKQNSFDPEPFSMVLTTG